MESRTIKNTLQNPKAPALLLIREIQSTGSRTLKAYGEFQKRRDKGLMEPGRHPHSVEYPQWWLQYVQNESSPEQFKFSS